MTLTVSEAEASLASPQTGRQILVVDDDLDIRESLAEVLEYGGFTSLLAPNGQAALALLESAPRLPDLILLDLMMPVMDGWEFRQLQLARDDWRDIPVIIISAGGNVEKKALNLRVQGCIRKPLEMETLLREVRKALPRELAR